MLKVLHIYRTYFPDTQGGGEELIRQICSNTQALGVENRVFTLSPAPADQPLERPEARVVQVRRHLEIASCSMSLTALKQFNREVQWADILHYHFPWPFGDILHLLSRHTGGKPVVISYLSDVVRQKTLYFFYQPLMRKFLARVDAIVATSPNYRDSSPLLKAYSNKVSVIPIGLDNEGAAAADPQKVARFKECFGDSFMLFVGVLRYYKGLHFLIEAASKTAATIVIAGSGSEESKLKILAEQRGLTNVHFLGRISDADKSALLQACRGFVFPSHLPSESFGISLLEAAMAGKAMISCEIGTGTSYVNIHNKTGLVIEPANPAALAEAITQLADNQALAEHYGAQAQQRYRDLFTGTAMGSQYLNLYQRLLASKISSRS
ncbi:MAG: glycosyltransferase [Porticoccaceae bacterium]|nr:glycosyltransferase [Porticoccaceae bacterium]